MNSTEDRFEVISWSPIWFYTSATNEQGIPWHFSAVLWLEAGLVGLLERGGRWRLCCPLPAGPGEALWCHGVWWQCHGLCHRPALPRGPSCPRRGDLMAAVASSKTQRWPWVCLFPSQVFASWGSMLVTFVLTDSCYNSQKHRVEPEMIMKLVWNSWKQFEDILDQRHYLLWLRHSSIITLKFANLLKTRNNVCAWKYLLLPASPFVKLRVTGAHSSVVQPTHTRNFGGPLRYPGA